jgi:hypothetical protein
MWPAIAVARITHPNGQAQMVLGNASEVTQPTASNHIRPKNMAYPHLTSGGCVVLQFTSMTTEVLRNSQENCRLWGKD